MNGWDVCPMYAMDWMKLLFSGALTPTADWVWCCLIHHHPINSLFSFDSKFEGPPVLPLLLAAATHGFLLAGMVGFRALRHQRLGFLLSIRKAVSGLLSILGVCFACLPACLLSCLASPAAFVDAFQMPVAEN